MQSNLDFDVVPTQRVDLPYADCGLVETQEVNDLTCGYHWTATQPVLDLRDEFTCRVATPDDLLDDEFDIVETQRVDLQNARHDLVETQPVGILSDYSVVENCGHDLVPTQPVEVPDGDADICPHRNLTRTDSTTNRYVLENDDFDENQRRLPWNRKWAQLVQRWRKPIPSVVDRADYESDMDFFVAKTDRWAAGNSPGGPWSNKPNLKSIKDLPENLLDYVLQLATGLWPYPMGTMQWKAFGLVNRRWYRISAKHYLKKIRFNGFSAVQTHYALCFLGIRDHVEHLTIDCGRSKRDVDRIFFNKGVMSKLQAFPYSRPGDEGLDEHMYSDPVVWTAEDIHRRLSERAPKLKTLELRSVPMESFTARWINPADHQGFRKYDRIVLWDMNHLLQFTVIFARFLLGLTDVKELVFDDFYKPVEQNPDSWLPQLNWILEPRRSERPLRVETLKLGSNQGPYLSHIMNFLEQIVSGNCLTGLRIETKFNNISFRSIAHTKNFLYNFPRLQKLALLSDCARLISELSSLSERRILAARAKHLVWKWGPASPDDLEHDSDQADDADCIILDDMPSLELVSLSHCKSLRALRIGRIASYLTLSSIIPFKHQQNLWSVMMNMLSTASPTLEYIEIDVVRAEYYGNDRGLQIEDNGQMPYCEEVGSFGTLDLYDWKRFNKAITDLQRLKAIRIRMQWFKHYSAQNQLLRNVWDAYPKTMDTIREALGEKYKKLLSFRTYVNDDYLKSCCEGPDMFV